MGNKLNKLKVMTIFGTRPEAVKMAPLVHELEKYPDEIESIVCVTAQQRQMLDQVLDVFNVRPNYDLDIMQHRQTLTDITVRAMEGLEKVLLEAKPDVVLVHGDTSTTFVASLVALYHQIKVGHVEAGLRTWNKWSPFPEEMNRQLTGVIADLHFAPTSWSANNLRNENKREESIFITGNTVVDSMKTTVREDYYHPSLEAAKGKKLVLMTAHRRENIGDPMRSMFRWIRRLVDEHEDLFVVYPVHLNPAVVEVANEVLGNHDRIQLVEPLNVTDFHNFISRSHLIITDSGGIQEEAPTFGVPTLVMRDTSERPEGIGAGTLLLVGTDSDQIFEQASLLLTDEVAYSKMSNASNPYGDGEACRRIVDALLYSFGRRSERPDTFQA